MTSLTAVITGQYLSWMRMIQREIGWILDTLQGKNLTLSRLGDRYVSALKKYLDESSREYEEI